MDHVCHEVVVALEFLALQVGLHHGFVWKQDLSDPAVVAPLHKSLNAHECVGATEANDGLGAGLDWVVGLLDWHEACLGDQGVNSLTVLASEDLCAVAEHYHLALVDVVNDEDTVLSDLHAGIGLGINLFVDLQAARLILNGVVTKFAASAHTLRVSGSPYALSSVLHS